MSFGKKLGMRTHVEWLIRALPLVVLCFLPALTPNAQASATATGLDVTLPNGYANLSVTDLRLKSTAGDVKWRREWNGQEWKFNAHWENLSQSWRNLTGSQSADTTAGTVGADSAGRVSSPGPTPESGCWIWVDEDWSASVGNVGSTGGGAPQAVPMLPARTTPFNRTMSGAGSADYAPAVSLSVNYASLCAGSSANSSQTLEGVRRLNELYLGEGGRYAFDNRTVLEKRPVQGLPPVSETQLIAGSLALAPIAIAKGYRWQDRGGDWIDYNTQGQVIAYGDKNANALWLARDDGGTLRGVVDATGHVLYTLHYSGELLTEIRDYPIAGNPLDLPARSVKYNYDSLNRLTQVTDVRGNVTQYDYDLQNRITRITDPEGRIDQLAYNGSMVAKHTAPDGGISDYSFEYDDTNKQFASKITGPETSAGRRVENYTHNRAGKLVRRIVNGLTMEEVRYDTGARIETHTNARGFTQVLTRNEFDQIVQTQNEDGTVTSTKYEARWLNPVEKTDEAGIKTQYQYDAKGNLVKTIEAVGTADERVTEYQVNSLGQYTKATRKGRTEGNGAVTLDATWQMEYDVLGQISKTVDPEGNARQYGYNRIGSLLSTVNPLGLATRYEVDAGGRYIKATNALDHARQFAYNKTGKLTQYTDQRGKVTSVVYDAMGRYSQITTPVGGVVKIQFNSQGRPVQASDADGRSGQAEYDNFGRITQLVDGLGNAIEFGYQVAGAIGALYGPTEIKYPTVTEQQRYDQRERPTSETVQNPNAEGNQTLTNSATYDPSGRFKSETDANGKISSVSRNALGRRIEYTDTLGNKTQASYDTRGNVIQLTDAKGNVHKFEYDRSNRLIRENLPLGQTMQYQYDAAGRYTQRIDPNGNKRVYTYDAANRVTESKQYNAQGTLQRTTAYIRDPAGNLTGWSDTDHSRNQTTSATATYDAANRKTAETITYFDGYSLTYGYGYSAAGFKTKLTWPDGAEIAYSYSAHGMLENVSIPGEGSISVNQYKWIVPTKLTLPGGTVQEKSYDGLLNLESLKVKNAGQQTVLSLQNNYGKLLELKQSTRTDSANGGSTGKSSSYSHDNEERLTQVQTDTGGLFGSNSQTFTLDAVANRTNDSQVGGAWQYDANNRLIQRGEGGNATTYTYDDAGNLTRKTEGTKVTQYGYDATNRLIEVKDGTNSLIARYGYDPLGRRIWKEQYRDGQGNPLSTQMRTHYLYADEGLIAEATQDIILHADQTVTANGSPSIVVQYGPNPDSSFTTGILFVKARNSNGQDTVGYFHHDHLQTPLQATDKAGNVIWAANYDAFGRATIITPSATAETPTINVSLRLPGQIEDEETGLYYNKHRYYDPATGRYTTRDPIGLRGGMNTYGYVYHSPLNYVDPNGLIAPAIIVGGIIAGAAIIAMLWPRDPPAGGGAGAGGKGLGPGDDSPLAPPGGSPSPTVPGGGKPFCLPKPSWPAFLPPWWPFSPPMHSEPAAEPDPAPPAAKPDPDAPPLVDPEKIPDFDHDDPTKPPVGKDGTEWPWKGKPPQGGDKGGYKNPNGPESLHPDLDHGEGIGPHWDFNDRQGRGYRIFPDGSIKPK